jgi:hypothetical protein
MKYSLVDQLIDTTKGASLFNTIKLAIDVKLFTFVTFVTFITLLSGSGPDWGSKVF